MSNAKKNVAFLSLHRDGNDVNVALCTREEDAWHVLAQSAFISLNSLLVAPQNLIAGMIEAYQEGNYPLVVAMFGQEAVGEELWVEEVDFASSHLHVRKWTDQELDCYLADAAEEDACEPDDEEAEERLEKLLQKYKFS